jgi:hypothetical protein
MSRTKTLTRIILLAPVAAVGLAVNFAVRPKWTVATVRQIVAKATGQS